MSEQSKLTYDQWSNLLDQAGVMAAMAEVHGLISGLLSAGVKPEPEQILPILSDFLNDGQALPVSLQKQVEQLIQATAADLNQADFSFSLVLPTDDDSLAERLEAMVEWAQAFLVGFAVQQTDLSLLPADVREAIEQLSEVTRIDIHACDDTNDEENEESYFLVLEHIKIMVLNCHAEVGQKFSSLAASNKTVH
ncbi:UPF0149 family protein [Rheinheimera sp. MMS21-TC3]|uniref:UPF0149 family protein n=1 Tax=Rheinheimera sp. MMS21-TC3 TaxID=3072790 RepID=UPI0028C41D7C|nr:UPF0149 family protein [Rheinheimera sp. MMS21-TC3]WNO61335.1 UPF0149 family protein [Rheinheimera sp. MMS21-TC3]